MTALFFFQRLTSPRNLSLATSPGDFAASAQPRSLKTSLELLPPQQGNVRNHTDKPTTLDTNKNSRDRGVGGFSLPRAELLFSLPFTKSRRGGVFSGPGPPPCAPRWLRGCFKFVDVLTWKPDPALK